MDVPKRIIVDFPKDSANNGNTAHMPAGYYDSDDDYDDYDDDDSPYRIQVEPTTRIMSPPKTLTAADISEEERRRYLRDNSMSAATGPTNYAAEESMYKTPNDSVLKNINNFQSGDPISLARQVRHLHNRVKLLETELQTQDKRQIFLFGILSIYMITKGIRWMYKN